MQLIAATDSNVQALWLNDSLFSHPLSHYAAYTIMKRPLSFSLSFFFFSRLLQPNATNLIY